jgi:hypothetical protein
MPMTMESAAYVDFKVKFNASVSDPWSQQKRSEAKAAFEAFRRGFRGSLESEIHTASWDYRAVCNYLENDVFLMPGNAESELKVLKMAILRAFVRIFSERAIRLKQAVAVERLQDLCEASKEACEGVLAIDVT